jgi:hypothetical protein
MELAGSGQHSCGIRIWNVGLLPTFCWLLLLLLAMVFHGCHVGGHDDDLLRAAYPNVYSSHGQ